MFFVKEDGNVNNMHKRIGLVIIALILFVSVVPMFIIGMYSRPSADDYSYAIETYHLIRSGDWDIASLMRTAYAVDVYFFNNWQGLYSSAFLLALQPGIFGEEYYFIGAWILMGLLYVSILYLSMQVAKVIGGIQKRYIALFSLFIYAVLMQGMPCITQGIYWFNGAWNYTFFLCMVFINVGLIIGYRYQKKNGIINLILATVLSFIISGGNHVTSFLNILILAIAVLFYVRKKWAILFPFFSAVKGFDIMYRAPGTWLRQGNEAKQDVLSTVIHSAWGCYEYLCEWINVQFIFLLVLLIPVTAFIASKVKIDVKACKLHPFVCIMAELVLICGMLCVPFMAMGHFGERRIENVIWSTFILCSVANWIYCLLWSGVLERICKCNINIKHILASIAICLVVCFFGKANIYTVIDDLLTGAAMDYAEACDERYQLMQESKEGTVLYVDELPKSEVLLFSDLSEDIAHWKNAAWKSYYGVDMVVKD